MRLIKLTQNKFALVDDADYEWLNQFRWYAHQDKNIWYASRYSHRIGNKKIYFKMHRELLGLRRGNKQQCDHIDGNGLNNCRSNLRVCTNQQNQFNQQPQKRITTSMFKGVSYHNPTGKWQARIKYDSKEKFLGVFNEEIKAAYAYDEKSRELFGEFARLNFPVHPGERSKRHGRKVEATNQESFL